VKMHLLDVGVVNLRLSLAQRRENCARRLLCALADRSSRNNLQNLAQMPPMRMSLLLVMLMMVRVLVVSCILPELFPRQVLLSPNHHIDLDRRYPVAINT